MKITVRDVLALLRSTDEIHLVWGDSAIHFDPRRVLDVDAYGDYVISGICPTDRHSIEIDIAAMPVKISSADRA